MGTERSKITADGARRAWKSRANGHARRIPRPARWRCLSDAWERKPWSTWDDSSNEHGANVRALVVMTHERHPVKSTNRKNNRVRRLSIRVD